MSGSGVEKERQLRLQGGHNFQLGFKRVQLSSFAAKVQPVIIKTKLSHGNQMPFARRSSIGEEGCESLNHLCRSFCIWLALVCGLFWIFRFTGGGMFLMSPVASFAKYGAAAGVNASGSEASSS